MAEQCIGDECNSPGGCSTSHLVSGYVDGPPDHPKIQLPSGSSCPWYGSFTPSPISLPAGENALGFSSSCINH